MLVGWHTILNRIDRRGSVWIDVEIFKHRGITFEMIIEVGCDEMVHYIVHAHTVPYRIGVMTRAFTRLTVQYFTRDRIRRTGIMARVLVSKQIAILSQAIKTVSAQFTRRQ